MRRTTTTYWPALLEEFNVSGLTQKKFCEQHRVSLATFCYWRKKQRDEANTSAPQGGKFIQLDVMHGAGAPSTASRADHEELIVELPLGVVMRFRAVRR